MAEIDTRQTPEHYIDVPEEVGVFDSWETLQGSMCDVLIAGFSRFDICMLAGEEAMRYKLGRQVLDRDGT